MYYLLVFVINRRQISLKKKIVIHSQPEVGIRVVVIFICIQQYKCSIQCLDDTRISRRIVIACKPKKKKPTDFKINSGVIRNAIIYVCSNSSA